jgi:hypothetical protein
MTNSILAFYLSSVHFNLRIMLELVQLQTYMERESECMQMHSLNGRNT